MSERDRVAMDRVQALLSSWERELIADSSGSVPRIPLNDAASALRDALYGSAAAPFWFHLTRDEEQLDIAVVGDLIVSPEALRGSRADDTLSQLFRRHRWDWTITSDARPENAIVRE